MPKDRRVNSPSFDRAMVSPYSKLSDHKKNISSPHAGNEKEWEEARCPICMEHPHNAVLLLCACRKKGCRPFICDTSYRHSNCLDQFRKSAAASSLPFERQQSDLVCPLCRGPVTGWDIIQPAREFMNSKTRTCSLETCDFIGNYADLRKHARLKHPYERPSEASPTRQSNWTILEQQREMEDALAHQSDIEYDFEGWPSWNDLGDDDFWSEGSFFDFPSGMSDLEDEVFDEMFSELSLSMFSLYPSSPDGETLDSGSSRSSDRPQMEILSSNTNSRPDNHVGNASHNSRSRLSYNRENAPTNSRPRLSNRRENNGSNNFSVGHRRESVPTSLRARSGFRRENGSSFSRSRSSYGRENGPASSRATSSYYTEAPWPSPRRRSRYYTREVAPSSPVRGPSPNPQRWHGSSRRPQSGYWRRRE